MTTTRKRSSKSKILAGLYFSYLSPTRIAVSVFMCLEQYYLAEKNYFLNISLAYLCCLSRKSSKLVLWHLFYPCDKERGTNFESENESNSVNEQNRERGREREKECVHGSVLVKVWVCGEVCERCVCAECVQSVCLCEK